MKKTLFIVAVILSAFLLASCGDLLAGLLGGLEDPVTISERLEGFVTKINNEQWDSIYQDMHPDALNYDQSKEGTFWSDLFTNENYAIPYATPTTGADSVMTTTMTYDIGDTEFSDNVTITFRQSGEDWYIYKIEREGTELFRRIGQ